MKSKNKTRVETQPKPVGDSYWGTEEFRVWFEGVIENHVDRAVSEFVDNEGQLQDIIEEGMESLLHAVRKLEKTLSIRMALAVDQPLREGMYRVLLEATRRHEDGGDNRPIGVLGLNAEIVNALVKQGFFSIAQLRARARDRRDLLVIPGISKKAVGEIYKALKESAPGNVSK